MSDGMTPAEALRHYAVAQANYRYKRRRDREHADGESYRSRTTAFWARQVAAWERVIGAAVEEARQ